MIQYQNIIENALNIKIDYSTKYLSFTINFEDNKNDEKNEEDKANKNEDIDECNGNDEEKNDYIDDDDNLNISDDEDNTENLIINVEFLEYNKKNNIGDIYNDTYYLMFHHIQGEICDYYFYLKQLKEIAKQLLKQVINNE